MARLVIVDGWCPWPGTHASVQEDLRPGLVLLAINEIPLVIGVSGYEARNSIVECPTKAMSSQSPYNKTIWDVISGPGPVVFSTMPSPSGWTDIDFETAAAALWLTQTELDFEHRMHSAGMDALKLPLFHVISSHILVCAKIFAQRSLLFEVWVVWGVVSFVVILVERDCPAGSNQSFGGTSPLPRCIAISGHCQWLAFRRVGLLIFCGDGLFSFLGHILWPKLVERSCGKNSNCICSRCLDLNRHSVKKCTMQIYAELKWIKSRKGCDAFSMEGSSATKVRRVGKLRLQLPSLKDVKASSKFRVCQKLGRFLQCSEVLHPLSKVESFAGTRKQSFGQSWTGRALEPDTSLR